MPPASSASSRDVSPIATLTEGEARSGRYLISTIAIDRYRARPELRNAVADAKGVRTALHQLGFADAAPPLLDAEATGAAIHALVADQLRQLVADDHLVVFYAGHGASQVDDRDGRRIASGYLIPVDADDRLSSWISLQSWLHAIARLPPRHILVILDACYSGIALDPVVRWRGEAAPQRVPFAALRERWSRRIITSALDDERAADAGPSPGHSLFTGCLLEALHGAVPSSDGLTTGSDLAVWVRQRVQRYPGAAQTPDFGTFELHDHGEMVIPLSNQRPGGPPGASATQPAPRPPVSRPAHRRPATARRATVATATLALLRREREWLMLVVPLTVIAALVSGAASC